MSEPKPIEDAEWSIEILPPEVYGPAEPPCLGISWLWALLDSHPFYPAAVIHDENADDGEFSGAAGEIAKDCDSTKLKAEAVLFYTFCRAWKVYRKFKPYKE